VFAAFRVDLDYPSYEEYLANSPSAQENPITPEYIYEFRIEFMILEFIFLTGIYVNFFTSYIHDDTGNEVKNIKKISKRYFYGNFIFDFVTIFPLSLFFRGFKFSRCLILIKCLRLVQLKEFLDINKVMAQIKGLY
jgi:hypothetical protein